MLNLDLNDLLGHCGTMFMGFKLAISWLFPPFYNALYRINYRLPIITKIVAVGICSAVHIVNRGRQQWYCLKIYNILITHMSGHVTWKDRISTSDGGLETWFYGSRSRLSKVSVSSRSRGSKVSVSLETTLSRPQDLKE